MEINNPAMKDDHRNDQPPNNTVIKASSIQNPIQVLGFNGNNNHFLIARDFGNKIKKAKPVRCQVKQLGDKFSCGLCDKQFMSKKAVYGHFRCHKNDSKKSETSKIIPKNKGCLPIDRLNPIMCKKKRSLRRRRACFSSCSFNNPYSLFDSKSSPLSSVNDDDVDDEMREGAETLFLFSCKAVVFSSHNHVSRDNDGSRKRKREEEEDDEGLIKPFKRRRLNQTHDENENGRFKRFNGLHYGRRNK